MSSLKQPCYDNIMEIIGSQYQQKYEESKKAKEALNADIAKKAEIAREHKKLLKNTHKLSLIRFIELYLVDFREEHRHKISSNTNPTKIDELKAKIAEFKLFLESVKNTV